MDTETNINENLLPKKIFKILNNTIANTNTNVEKIKIFEEIKFSLILIDMKFVNGQKEEQNKIK